MDFTNMSFAAQENIIEFDENGFREDGTQFGEIFSAENIVPTNDSFNTESFSTLGESFSQANDSFVTAVDYTEAPEENFDSENGEFRESHVFLMDGGDRFGVSSIAFDVKEELVWAGNQGGHVTSYLSSDTMKYTSFQMHESEDIRALATIDGGVLAITPTSFIMRTRQGLPLFKYISSDFNNLQCMLPTKMFSNRILLGGLQSNLIEYDLHSMEVVKKYPVGDEGCVILREHPRFICHGSTNGQIILHDPRSMRKEYSFQAHLGTLSDFDTQGYYITTCGFSNRMGQMIGDQFVMVYDMRMMKMSLPLRALVPPYFLRFMPGLTSCLAAVSLMGQWVVMDAAQPESSLVSMNYQDTELPIVEEPSQSIPITDVTTPLSSIPLPTPPIDPVIMQSMRMVGAFGYAPNTLNKKRNQVPYKLCSHRGHRSQLADVQGVKNEEGGIVVHVPIRYRRIEIKYSKIGIEEFDFDSYNRTSFSGLDMSLPNSYCNPMLQMFYYVAPLRASILSHLCEKEFCLACELSFLFHMLDINVGQGIPCHASNFLRAFRTIPEASAMSLTISDQDNRSRINFASKIQSWNCFVLQQIHSETLESKERDLYGIKDPLYFVETLGGYRLDAASKLVLEAMEKPETSPVSEIFGANVTSINKCSRCCNQIEKDVTSLTVNLSFHESASELAQGSVPFATVIQKSICSHQVTQAWCDSCGKYQPVEQFKKFKSLPSVIAMNCGLDSPQDLKFWQTQHEFLLSAVHEKLTDEAKEYRESEETSKTDDDNTSSPVMDKKRKDNQRYGLSPMRLPGKIRPCRYGTACVRVGCHFWHPSKDKDDNSTNQILSLLDQTMEYSWIPLGLRAKLNDDGFVVMSNINKDEIDSAEDDENGNVYHLMGVVSHVSDPNILPITPEEAVWFPCGWKTPCVLYWVRATLPPHVASMKESHPITIDVFGEDKSLAQRGRKRITFTPLTSDEMPSEGPLAGTAFLDDYISTQEQVVDYLTQFSGIKPGDLDANYSQKHLTTLKSTYVKLRYLIDKGVKIVGHGLKNDFRVINMVVPQKQLIDTVHLFHIPHSRMVALKFLAWYFLKLKIQSVTHDSIEDAKTALALYHEYLRLSKIDDNILVELQKMYEIGKEIAVESSWRRGRRIAGSPLVSLFIDITLKKKII
ncbi:PAB-dependent poly(A)-specific ribonuclease subunit PAN2 [Armadillidium nasatum]|uniref:PAB-dependent poly(A)-specific ribonuclease subunit PAN2 n=1 Tax=Armadillidium nasatum TaxID=96803 RepID=A0A5N5SWB7_9CRUS|nr:PAB-dependent poly(A)-specific ribonuclease subunit PAN2 [Armadillidium nasatum]